MSKNKEATNTISINNHKTAYLWKINDDVKVEMVVAVDLNDVSLSDVINGQNLRKSLRFKLHGELVWPFHRLRCLENTCDANVTKKFALCVNID